MLDLEFFPTPADIVELMYDKVKNLKRGSRILDPMAGSGNLLDRTHIHESWLDRYDVYAIEIDPELRLILTGKKITVIGSDFTTYSEPVKFDLVIMNPTFSNGATHILKAWEYVEDGGQLVSLVNRETIDNPFSSDRKVLKGIIEKFNGEVIELGECFRESERFTSVSVNLVSIQKPKQASKIDFTKIKFDTEELEDPTFLANPLAQSTPIKNLVARYKIAQDLLIQRYQLQSKIDFYLADIENVVYRSSLHDISESLKTSSDLNNQIKVLKSRFWNTIFKRTKMGAQTTSLFQKKFDEFAVNQSNMAFTEDNVMEVFMIFFGNQQEIMQDCLIEVFDKATSYHVKNKIYKEGWITNKSYMIGKRIILPKGVYYDKWGFSLNHYERQFFDDLDKVLSWLTGKAFETIGHTYEQIRKKVEATGRGRQASNSDYKEWFESEFFRIRIYKKGTVWLDFKDNQVLDSFNRKAAEGKNWIGGGY